MSKLSNNRGRAYEFSCINVLLDAISKIRKAQIIVNSSYEAAEKAWDTLSESEKNMYILSAKSTIDTIFALEPNIIEKSDDILNLYIQKDRKGEIADVRDIIIERNDVYWKIGLSIKHNHEAVKHSRIAKDLDFGEKWYGIPCSIDYWKEVEPIFNFLEIEKAKGTKFSELKSKKTQIYLPLLNAFIKEISTKVKTNRDIPKKLVEYLLSKYDFYKVISVDSQRLTTIQSFNMYGTLNLPSKVEEPAIKVPIVNLPKQLLCIGIKPKSSTTVYMCFDNGWQFSFRIHNAEKVATPSLKFDINIVGMPLEVNIKYNCKW